MAFNWNAYRLNRLSNAVRAYNAAITRKSNVPVNNLDELTEQAIFNSLARKVTVEEIKSRIKTENDFRRIVGYPSDKYHGKPSELDRILKSVDPHALDIVPSPNKRGGYDLKYNIYKNKVLKREREQNINERRDNMGKSLYPDDPRTEPLDTEYTPKYANDIDNNDLGLNDDGERDYSIEDQEPTVYNGWEAEDNARYSQRVTPTAKLDEYMSELTSFTWHHRLRTGYADFVYALEWLADNRPDILNKTFDAGYDWVDPLYLYESGDVPYSNIDIEYRYANARDNWLSIYNQVYF